MTILGRRSAAPGHVLADFLSTAGARRVHERDRGDPDREPAPALPRRCRSSEESTLGKLWGVISQPRRRELAHGRRSASCLLGVLARAARLGPKVPGRARRPGPRGGAAVDRARPRPARAWASSGRCPQGCRRLTYPQRRLRPDFGDLLPARGRAGARGVLGGGPHGARLRRAARRERSTRTAS